MDYVSPTQTSGLPIESSRVHDSESFDALLEGGNISLSEDTCHGSLQSASAMNRALRRYMQEFHAGKDPAMCNIHNRTIPVVQIPMSFKNLLGHWHSQTLTSNVKCEWQWRYLAERVRFSGSCSRCLIFSPVPCPKSQSLLQAGGADATPGAAVQTVDVE
jgi:hypothetical protein